MDFFGHTFQQLLVINSLFPPGPVNARFGCLVIAAVSIKPPLAHNVPSTASQAKSLSTSINHMIFSDNMTIC